MPVPKHCRLLSVTSFRAQALHILRPDLTSLQQGRRRKNAVQEEPVDESIDWLQTNLLSLPEEAGRDNLTPDDRRKLLMCLLDPEELEGDIAAGSIPA